MGLPRLLLTLEFVCCSVVMMPRYKRSVPRGGEPTQLS
jgi:hypothetical protein